jgi:hypothetical protein
MQPLASNVVALSTYLHPKFQPGVVVISGLWGLGKSTLIFTTERPGRVTIRQRTPADGHLRG